MSRSLLWNHMVFCIPRASIHRAARIRYSAIIAFVICVLQTCLTTMVPRSFSWSLVPCDRWFIVFAMSSPDTSPSCGSRGKARYLSPAMAAIRAQKLQMTKTLKNLRKDMKKEPRAVTDTRVVCTWILMFCSIETASLVRDVSTC